MLTYVYYTQNQVDAFGERKSMRLYYHAPSELGAELMMMVLRWYIPNVSRVFRKGGEYIDVWF